ncbi:LCP family protein [Fictibacillus sp. Mic-4]|uniref:LCP family glycopolymer transferase n=1 Tax=Fictibacillus sp. Mic-4 TaxID=3132826 RepID=UPI003CEE0CBD
MEQSRANRHKKKRSNWRKIISSILVILLLSAGGYGFYIYHSIKGAANEMHSTKYWSGSKLRTGPLDLESGQPISILIMGVDERANDVGRSDTLVMVTVNPKDESIKMTSIPRDTRTEIVGHGTIDKINHSYAFGGPKMTIQTVEHFLNVPVDFYVKVNMKAFKKIIDALGGITVQNKFTFTTHKYTFKQGELTLNGDQALDWARMRKKDPRGDLGRNERQRQVIQKVINEGAKPSTLTKLDDIINVLGKNIETNMTFDEMKTIQANYMGARKHIQSVEIGGSPQTINGISYYVVPEQERLAVSNELKKHLGLNQ